MKKTVGTALIFTLLIALAGCGGSGPEAPAASNPPASGPPGPAAPVYAWDPDSIREHTFILGHGMAATSQVGMQYHEFALAVAELSKGKMTIDERIDGTLVTDTETLAAIMDGTVDFCHSMGSYVTGTIADLSPLTIAGYYGGGNWLNFATDTHTLIADIYSDYGIKYIGALYQGNSVIVCTERQITEPSDVAGLLFRASGTWVSRTVEAWGGRATTIGLADLAEAFSEKIVQGTATGMNIIVPFDIYKVAEYITITTITEGFAALLMNGETWASLNADEQALITEAGKVFERKAYDIAIKLVDEYIRTVEAGGLNEIYRLTPAEQQEFIKVAYSLYPQMEEELGPKGKELIILLKQINGIQ